MNKLRVGSWVRYKIEKAKNSSNDPFSIPSSTSGEKEVYAVVIQVDDNNCTITYTCQDELYNVPVFKTVLTSIGSVEMVCPSGRCPEDDTLATSEYHCSGYQPNAGSKFDLKKSISTNPSNPSTCCEEVEECTKREYVSPAERALDMVSDYCMEKVRNYFFSNSPAEECNHKAEAYFDVRNFIQDYIERHMADWEIQEKERNPVDENDELKHCKKEAKWYKKRMEQYRKSFFMVCNLIDTCGVPESIKYFVKQEELRY